MVDVIANNYMHACINIKIAVTNHIQRKEKNNTDQNTEKNINTVFWGSEL